MRPQARQFTYACLLTVLTTTLAAAKIVHDPGNKSLTISDAAGALELRLNYERKCVLDRVVVGGQQVLSPPGAVSSGIKISNQWFTSQSCPASPQVKVTRNQVEVRGIPFGGCGVQVAEDWHLTAYSDRIVWRIDRTYHSDAMLEDISLPAWNFNSLSTWTGALLGHGGVAWCRLFNAPNASYGVANGTVAFWNKDSGTGLRIVAHTPSQLPTAVRFTHRPSGEFSCNYSVDAHPFVPKHNLSRFQRNDPEIWAPSQVRPGTVAVEYTLSAFDYPKTFDLGTLKDLDGSAIREIRHTIARIGAVDELIHGSNGYYSDCAVLHEPWLAQLGLLIADPAYARGLANTLDFQREHAIGPDGRVKARWAGTSGDAMPGTYDACGYYEAQWGCLMDSQPSWVINVTELFDLTADRAWLARQKMACERALDYLLRRDSDGDGLVEMFTDSCHQARGSDWLDVIWASYENALVNAQMYWAMTHWASLEELLGDRTRADEYRAAASKLKARFNQTTAEGGFWDPQNQCYAYWRDKDNSVHGTNLVVPVNFSAIGYGLCDHPARCAAILNRIELLMQQEQLFFWPLCFFPYAPGEAHPSQYPFPTYENGDIFLAWGELGTRAYAAENPNVALKYVKKVLAQYGKDGLAFQRYRRRTQVGTGDDILANNCSIVVGLYRNIYGVQPRYNRLYLDPHLTPELNGTKLNYSLRGQSYTVDLNTNAASAAVEDFSVQDTKPFALNVRSNTCEYFFRDNPAWAISVTRSFPAPLKLRVEAWSANAREPRRWTETLSQAGLATRHVLRGLEANGVYQLLENGVPQARLVADSTGQLKFRYKSHSAAPVQFEIRAE